MPFCDSISRSAAVREASGCKQANSNVQQVAIELQVKNQEATSTQ
jgi:hypothetical protein